ncbi:hypothetical protein CLCR_03710 [Cladophialophora carrionii]|uniref:Uncharacterized protein n=1 Tax=Cladophialophora carrionii TaxID=86049 RepID=A0A1C1CGT8_9EURO|nr:hypothetical protein CLCR_03710 [Cladophialophora carrionii]
MATPLYQVCNGSKPSSQLGPRSYPQIPIWIPQANFVTTSPRRVSCRERHVLSSPSSKEAHERVEELKSSGIPLYPRYRHSPQKRSFESIRAEVDKGNTGDGLDTLSEVAEGKNII